MSRGLYQYRAHGFTISSELELPELVPFDGVPDVLMRLGPVAADLDGPVRHGPGYQAAEGRYLLDVPGIARYLVTDGREVRIAPAPGALESGVRVFLLSSVMAALTHQRGLLAMHASTVAFDGGAVLFAGESGAGKSTISAAFHDRGYPIITDDISVVAFDRDGHPMIQPGYRHLRLTADALDHVGASLGARRKMALGEQKYGVTVPGAAPPAPVPIRRMFLLTDRPAATISLRPLDGPAKVTAVVRGTYRRRMSVALGRRSAHFALCVAVARRIEIVDVDRPRDLDRLHRLVDALEADLREPR
jgi:hypothetical protein